MQELVWTQGKNLGALSWMAVFPEMTLDLSLVGKWDYYYPFGKASSIIYDRSFFQEYQFGYPPPVGDSEDIPVVLLLQNLYSKKI